MAQDKKEKKKNSLMSRLKNKYRLVIMNDDTLEERLTFRLSRSGSMRIRLRKAASGTVGMFAWRR